MALLIAGLLIFFTVHFLPSMTSLRGRLIGRYGEGIYKLGFSLMAAVGLLLIIVGVSEAPYVPVYEPPTFGRLLAVPLVFVALYLIIARRAGCRVRKLTAHPMLVGVSLWAIAHLLANGDLMSILLFGSFLSYSVTDIVLANRRGAKKGEVTASWAKEFVVLVVVASVFLFLVWAHRYYAGMPLMP